MQEKYLFCLFNVNLTCKNIIIVFDNAIVKNILSLLILTEFFFFPQV